jgi:hypothetical protein
MRNIRTVLPILLIASLLGCASVPREVVELSYVLGADLTEVQRSHEALIRLHFDDLRRQTDDFLVNRWQPTYLRNFIADGGLVDLATDPDPNEVLAGVQDWAEIALEEIHAKRSELLDPLDAQEQELLEATGAAFARMRTANATITAHLGSIRQVEAAGDAELARLGLGDLRRQLDEGLAKAAAITEEGIRRTSEAAGIVDEARETIDAIRRRP